MPYCDDCQKYWTPNSLPADARCPTCGVQLEVPAGAGAADEDDDDEYRAPWHFKLLVVLTVVYLGWRFLQLFGILAG